VTQQLATCRFCGAQGVEDSDIDPAPGVCPACLDSRMAVVTQRVAEHGMAGAWDGLMWAGLSNEAATEFLVELAIVAGTPR
jgi:hypothetical protein